MCKNFIIIWYTKTKFDLKVDEAVGNFNLSSQKLMFEKMKYQLNCHYPDSFIHILTNEKMSCTNSREKVHQYDFEPTHCCKFLLYGLLDEPALYLDCDIVIKRKFRQHEISSSNAFRMYNSFGGVNGATTDYSKLSQKLNVETKNYNAGLIMIQEPNKKITKELQEIEANFFADKAFMAKSNIWPYNDEYATSYYIFKNNIQFEENSTVALLPNKTNHDVQSIHHTGISKQSFFSDFSKTYAKLI